ncbi:MAG TPA: DUF3369 domain-containing protein [Solimonas sp.]|nr:DUF3369 domain-containing protein [Solimonas sp.]
MNDLLGLREEAPQPAQTTASHWTILVVDDDPEVHSVTSLALDGFRFADRGLRFLHAHSGAEARSILAREPGIAVLLLDVVMETDDSGLEVVSYVREVLKNRFVRIVLRTGQPGQAPELDVITHYDINDYKHKTELTRQRLYTTIYTSLATYRDLMMLDANRRGLEKVIDASARIFELHSIDRFAQGVLDQLISLLLFEADAVMLQASGLATDGGNGDLRIVAGTGAFSSLVGSEARATLPLPVLGRIDAAIAGADNDFGADHFVGVQHGQHGSDLVFYVSVGQPMPQPDRNLLQMFFRNVAIARDNVQLLATAGVRK